jgi:hypothetical protein
MSPRSPHAGDIERLPRLGEPASRDPDDSGLPCISRLVPAPVRIALACYGFGSRCFDVPLAAWLPGLLEYRRAWPTVTAMASSVSRVAGSLGVRRLLSQPNKSHRGKRHSVIRLQSPSSSPGSQAAAQVRAPCARHDHVDRGRRGDSLAPFRRTSAKRPPPVRPASPARRKRPHQLGRNLGAGRARRSVRG